mgnify:CR=1 FL=1
MIKFLIGFILGGLSGIFLMTLIQVNYDKENK